MRKFELHSATSLRDASEAQRNAVFYIEVLSTLQYPHFVHLTNDFDTAEHQYSLSSVIGEPESEVIEALSHPDVDWFKAPRWQTWSKIVRKANKSEMIRQNQTWVSFYGSNPPSVATSYPELHADMTPPPMQELCRFVARVQGFDAYFYRKKKNLLQLMISLVPATFGSLFRCANIMILLSLG